MYVYKCYTAVLGYAQFDIIIRNLTCYRLTPELWHMFLQNLMTKPLTANNKLCHAVTQNVHNTDMQKCVHQIRSNQVYFDTFLQKDESGVFTRQLLA